MCIWKKLDNTTDCLLLLFYLCLISICQKLLHSFCQSISLFCERLPEKLSLDDPGCNICFRICSINAKYFTEAAFLRFMTGKRYNSSMFSSCLVKSIHRIPKEHLVENFHALYITGSHSEYDKILVFQRLRLNADIFSVLFTGIEIFTLRKESILR